MKALVDSVDKRADAMGELVNAHERDIKSMIRFGDRRDSHRFQLFAITLAALLGSILGSIPHYF